MSYDRKKDLELQIKHLEIEMKLKYELLQDLRKELTRTTENQKLFSGERPKFIQSATFIHHGPGTAK